MTRAHGHWRNGVARPTKTPTKPSELIETMAALSVSSTDTQEPTEVSVSSTDMQEPSVALSVNASKPDTQEPITESHVEPVEMTQSHIDVGEFNTTVVPPI